MNARAFFFRESLFRVQYSKHSFQVVHYFNKCFLSIIMMNFLQSAQQNIGNLVMAGIVFIVTQRTHPWLPRTTMNLVFSPSPNTLCDYRFFLYPNCSSNCLRFKLLNTRVMKMIIWVLLNCRLADRGTCGTCGTL